MAFECCVLCVKPKRHPGCHDHCPDYLAEKAEHDKRKAHQDKERRIAGGINQQRCSAISKAVKGKKHKGKRMKEG